MMVDDADNDDEIRNELGELEDRADELSSKEDFLSFLLELRELCSGDEVCWERRVIHFVDTVEDYIRHDLVELPKDQDWKALARLFIIGVFED
jgi:hypothetical protein